MRGKPSSPWLVLRGAVLCVCLLAVAACATPTRQSSSFDALLAQPYVLDSGDALRVTVFEQPSLSETYTVDVAGFISMPLIGDVPARGLTPDELDTSITVALRDGFLRNPDVSVEVATYRPFFVLGEVGQAGQFPYVAGMTVRSAIAIAGGFTARAARRTVDVSRTINGEVVSGRLRMNDAVRPGDTITVRERWF
ncbi:MAG: polysaccharide export protein [Devosiaceae bacterium]|nr:polysaccharide export protein [Devosiaceae bacterium MH13]